MNSQPNNPQSVVYNINNTNGNNYVNNSITSTTLGATMAELPKGHAESPIKIALVANTLRSNQCHKVTCHGSPTFKQSNGFG